MSRSAVAVAAWVALCFARPAPAVAHPVGFGVLQLEERSDGAWDVLLRVSGSRERAAAVEAVLPEECEELSPPVWESARRGIDRRFVVRCPRPLVGEVGVEGVGPDLSISLRVVRRDGSTELAMLDAAAPVVVLADGARLAGSVFAGYAALGVEHILTGADHLLFVFGLLLLLAERTRALVLTITSFTVGHSITLALATLGFVPLASAAAEAIIALSILLLAVELGLPDTPPTLTRRFPGLVAGGFGLVHGLGFAGALADVGLPRHDATAALLAFNVGVEAGQLLFVALALAALALAARFTTDAQRHTARHLAIYAIGVPAAYLALTRLL